MKIMIDKIVEYMNIDYNTFWTIVVTIIIAIIGSIVIPLCLKLVECLKKKREDMKIWKVNAKYIDDMFYMWLLLFYVIVSALIVILCYAVECIPCICHLRFFIVVLICVSIISFVNRLKKVRLALLRTEDRFKKLLINFPIILLCMGMYVMVEWEGSFLAEISSVACIIGLVICELRGFVVFYNSYTVYSFSYAKITTKSGNTINNIEIESLYKSNNWIEYKIEERKGKVLFDSVEAIEYYGEKKYILRDIMGEKYTIEDIGTCLM